MKLTPTMLETLRVIERTNGVSVYEPYGQAVGTCRALVRRGMLAETVRGLWRLRVVLTPAGHKALRDAENQA